MNVDIEEKNRLEKRLKQKCWKLKARRKEDGNRFFLLLWEQEISDFLCVWDRCVSEKTKL